MSLFVQSILAILVLVFLAMVAVVVETKEKKDLSVIVCRFVMVVMPLVIAYVAGFELNKELVLTVSSVGFLFASALHLHYAK